MVCAGSGTSKVYFYFLGSCKYVCATFESQCWSKLNAEFSLFYSPFLSKEQIRIVSTRVPFQLYGLLVGSPVQLV